LVNKLPDVAGRNNTVGNFSNWNSNLCLNCLTVLLGDLLCDFVAADSLLGVAVGDGNSLGGLLGSVDTHFLGHFTAVRLDGGVASARVPLGNLWGHMDSVGSWGGIPGRVAPIGTTISTGGVSIDASSISSLGFPLDDAMLDNMSWLAILGGHLLTLLLIGDGLLFNLLSVALLLGLWDTVLGFDFLVGDGTLWPGDSGGMLSHFDSWSSHVSHPGWCCVSSIATDGSSMAIAAIAAIAAVAAVAGLSFGRRGGGGVGHGGGHAGIRDKLVHGDLDFVTSHEELSS